MASLLYNSDYLGDGTPLTPQKGDWVSKFNATPMVVKPDPKEVLSGNYGTLHGLTDFSGQYKSKDNRPLVMQKATFDRFQKAQAIMKNDENFAKYFPKDWKPSFNYTYRPYDEQVALKNKYKDAAATPGSSPHEAGMAMDISIAGMTDDQYNIFDKAMLDAGLQHPKIKSGINKGKDKPNEKHHYEDYNDFKYASQGIAAVNSGGGDSDAAKADRAFYSKKDQAINKQYPSDPATAVLTAKYDNSLNPAATHYASTYTPWMVPPSDSIMTQGLNSFGNPVARLGVEKLRTNVDDFKQVKADVKNWEGAKADKLEKNRVKDKSVLGFEDKLDTPVHIRIYTDEVAVGTDKSSVSEAYQQLNQKGIPYIDCFILRSVRFVQEERYHIFQALNGETTSFFFGSKPVVYNFSGSLLDTNNQQWFNDFMYYYENYLRGTKVILNKTRIFMIYEDQIVEGFLLNTQVSRSGDMNSHAEFSFDMIMVQKTTTANYTNPLQRDMADIPSNQSLISQILDTPKALNQMLLSQVSDMTGTLLNTGSTGFNTSSGRVLTPPAVNPVDIINQLNQGLTDNVLNPALSLPSKTAAAIWSEAQRAYDVAGSIASKNTIVELFKNLNPSEQTSMQAKVNSASGKYNPLQELQEVI